MSALQLNEHTMDAKLALEQIALEAQFLKNMAQAIKDFFPSIFGEINKNKEVTINLLDELQKDKDIKLDKDQIFVLKEIMRHNFTEYNSMSTMVPNGFTGQHTFIDFIKQLEHSVDHLMTIEKTVLQRFYSEISAFITNKGDRASLNDLSNYYTALGKKSEQDLAKIGQFFKGDDTAYLPIGKVIHRGNDLPALYRELIVLDKKINTIDRGALKDSINKISDVMDMIILNAQQNKIDYASPEIIKSISNGAYIVAKELEYYSVVFFRVIMIKESVKNLTENLKKFIMM